MPGDWMALSAQSCRAKKSDRDSLSFCACVIQKLTICLYSVTRTLRPYEENWNLDGLVVDTRHRDWDLFSRTESYKGHAYESLLFVIDNKAAFSFHIGSDYVDGGGEEEGHDPDR